MKRNKGLVALVSVLAALTACCAVVILLLYWPKTPQETLTASPTAAKATAPQTVSTTEEEPVVSTVNLLAVGDNLIHNMVYNSGMEDEDNWNYDHLYAQVKEDVQAADVAVINQETIFVSDHKNVSSYPSFGTPREVGEAVANAGFDVILHATNHVLDKGIDNVYDAIDFWSDKDVTVLGIHKTQADADIPTVLEKNGIAMGMINYTYGFNGRSLPEDQTYAVDCLDNEEKLFADIAYCEQNADITIAFLHMGTEYATKPSTTAIAMVEQVVAAGADLLICCHPHVVEPYEIYTADNGNQAVVYYSLGNFISAQDELDRLIGGMAQVTIQKTVIGEESITEITHYTMTPLVTHTARGTAYTTYKLEDYTDELAKANLLVHTSTEELLSRYQEIVGEEE